MSGEHTTALLLRRWRDGDNRAREELYARLDPLLRRWAHGRMPQGLRDQADTGDLVQTALLRVLGRLEQFESTHGGALYSYVRTTLLNVMRDACRAQPQPQREPIDALADLPQPPGSALEAALGRDGLLAYEQALAGLEPAHRELVLMRFELGLSFGEIANELGESADGVRMKLNRALRRMAQMLDDDE